MEDSTLVEKYRADATTRNFPKEPDISRRSRPSETNNKTQHTDTLRLGDFVRD